MKTNLKPIASIKYALTALVFFLMGVDAMGCDCIMYPVSHYVKKSKNIVIAKVIETVPIDSQLYTDNRRVVLEVTKVFKGNLKVKKQLILIRDGNCDPSFTKNEEYLLFCFRKKRYYHIYHCSYSGRASTSSSVIGKIEEELKDS